MGRDYPLKHERVRQLEVSGFNTTDYIWFGPGELDPSALRRFFDRYKGKHGISLRHFHQDETRFFKCPVKYEVKDWNTALRFCQEHNREFFTIANEAIPPDEAVYGGNIWLLDERDFVIEYFEGPGTPRDTETHRKLKFIKRAIGERLPEDAPPELSRLATKFKSFIPDERPIVIEFNIYPYPVGKLRQKGIIWEWRQGLIHESCEIVHFLVTENEELKRRVEYLESLIVRIHAKERV